MDLSEFGTSTLREVDALLHRLKKQNAYPSGNPTFRLLMQISQPVCDEATKRSEAMGLK